MVGVEIIQKYIAGISSEQLDQLTKLGQLYQEWNDRINVVSRKDIERIYERHILHALLLTKFFSL